MGKLASVGAALAVALWASSGVAQEEECRGGKQWYEGACRYPDEIEKMKKAAEPKPSPKPPPEPVAPKPHPTEPEPIPIPTIPPLPPTPVPSPAPSAPPPPSVTPAPAPQPPVPMPSSPPPRRDVSISPLVWVGAAVAGAGVIVGAITGGISFGQAKELQDDCTDDLCPPERQDDIDEMILLANVSNATFAVAGAGAIVGVIGLAITDWSPGQEAASLEVDVGPGGLRIGGRF